MDYVLQVRRLARSYDMLKEHHMGLKFPNCSENVKGIYFEI